MEPYEGRTAHSVIEDVKLALGEYGTEETFARDPATSLPIFYIYDSYQIKPEDWAVSVFSFLSWVHFLIISECNKDSTIDRVRCLSSWSTCGNGSSRCGHEGHIQCSLFIFCVDKFLIRVYATQLGVHL